MANFKASFVILLISLFLCSCATMRRSGNRPKAIAKGQTFNGEERKPWITRFTIGMLEYFERKFDGDEDKHPAEKVWPPKK